MSEQNFTPTNVAKNVLTTVVALTANNLSTKAVEEYTEYDPNSKAVRIGTGLFGWYVSEKLSPVTDAIVDKTASRLKSWKNRKNNDETPES
jgi:hypothetical protein